MLIFTVTIPVNAQAVYQASQQNNPGRYPQQSLAPYQNPYPGPFQAPALYNAPFASGTPYGIGQANLQQGAYIQQGQTSHYLGNQQQAAAGNAGLMYPGAANYPGSNNYQAPNNQYNAYPSPYPNTYQNNATGYPGQLGQQSSSFYGYASESEPYQPFGQGQSGQQLNPQQLENKANSYFSSLDQSQGQEWQTPEATTGNDEVKNGLKQVGKALINVGVPLAASYFMARSAARGPKLRVNMGPYGNYSMRLPASPYGPYGGYGMGGLMPGAGYGSPLGGLPFLLGR